jgi:5-methylcytosine-specific restriction enzyme A
MPWSNESRQSRGYGAEWEKIRKVVMERDKGLCQPSLREGKVVRATEVDHIVSKAKARQMGWSDEQINDPRNLQAISHEKHLEKTARETGRTYRPKVRYGADGWPLE